MKLPPCQPPRIVIVGGGVAGLLLATRLGPAVARMHGRVTLVDRSWTRVWKPMLHTLAAGTWNIHQQQVQYLLHARTHRFGYVPGQVDAIDRVAKRVRLAPMQGVGADIAHARELEYDVLILAFGSRADDFGAPGVGEHCHFIDSQDQADAFNAHLRAHVARSEFQNRNIDIAIVGGGATGVELAAELSRMVDLAAGYGEADIRRRLRVTLLESSSRILAAFPEAVSASATPRSCCRARVRRAGFQRQQFGAGARHHGSRRCNRQPGDHPGFGRRPQVCWRALPQASRRSSH